MPAHHADVADVGAGPWITTRRRQETVVLAHAGDVTDGWLRTPDRSQISRVILASLRTRASKLRSACPPASSASSREQVVKVTSWPRRQAWWPSAAARWLLPTPTGP